MQQGVSVSWSILQGGPVHSHSAGREPTAKRTNSVSKAWARSHQIGNVIPTEQPILIAEAPSLITSETGALRQHKLYVSKRKIPIQRIMPVCSCSSRTLLGFHSALLFFFAVAWFLNLMVVLDQASKTELSPACETLAVYSVMYIVHQWFPRASPLCFADITQEEKVVRLYSSCHVFIQGML